MPRPQLVTALLRATVRQSKLQSTNTSARCTGTTRTFTSLPTLRPALPPLQSTTVFRAPTSSALSRPRLAPTDAAVDVVPPSAVTAHPALAATQIRCGPRPTMARTSRLIQKRRHGFLSRVKNAKGRNTLARRRFKGRRKLAAL